MPRNRPRRPRESPPPSPPANKEPWVAIKEELQVYAKVIRMVESGRYEAICSDNTVRICHFYARRVVLEPEDFVLVDVREGIAPYVFVKYKPDEARLLKAWGQLPDYMEIADGEEEGENNI